MPPPINRNTTRSDTEEGFETGRGMVIGNWDSRSENYFLTAEQSYQDY